MAYHSGQDKVILFGGHVSGTGSELLNHNQTWSYDLNTNTWTNLNPAVAPPAFCAGSMAYDSQSDLLVLFGGWPSSSLWDTFIAESWTFNLTANTLTNVTSSVHPSARAFTSMTYDSESDPLILSIIIVGGAAVVIIVIILIIKKKT